MDDSESVSTLYSLDARLDALQRLLEKRLPDSELATDYDVTAVVSCNAAAGFQCVPIGLPRTLRHVEIELSAVNTNSAAEGAVLFNGLISSAVAAQQIGFTGAGAQADSAICATGGGKVTARTYLDGSGYLTLCFVSVATPMIVNIRVRSLDVVVRSKNTADVANVEVGWE